MPKAIKVAACQVPEIREDIETALACIERYAHRAEAYGASLLCFPECFLQGYLTAEGQARRHALQLSSPAFASVLARLAKSAPMIVFGVIEVDEGAIFNTAVVVHAGRLIGRYRKMHLLPGEGLYTVGTDCPIFEVAGLKFGINICFDTQFPEASAALSARGAKLILCPANNMMQRPIAEQWKYRHNEMRARRARENRLWVISSDVTGERGDRISYGPTSAIDPDGRVVAQLPLREGGMLVTEISI
jgi:predicted amidohydrolase